MKKLILSVMCAAATVACCTQPAPKEGGKVPNEQKQWAWLGFERPEGANPVISPNTDIIHATATGIAAPMAFLSKDIRAENANSTNTSRK